MRPLGRALLLAATLAASGAWACTNPDGVAGHIIYNSSVNALQFCDGTDWVNLNTVSPTAPNTGCSNPVGSRGQIIFNAAQKTHQVCNGSQWADMSCGSAVTAGSSCANPTGNAGDMIRATVSGTEALFSCGGGSWARMGLPCGEGASSGQIAFTTPGAYSWTVPAGVTRVSVVCVGGGGFGTSGAAGGGGELRYKNNIDVTPGSSISLTVGAGGQASSFGSACIANPGQTPAHGGVIGPGGSGGTGDGGGNGGNGGAAAASYGSGGGAGGYSGAGGNGNGNGSPTSGSGGGGGGGETNTGGDYRIGYGGGGVGLLGQGANGTTNGGGGSGGANASGKNGGLYGGGAGASDIAAPAVPGQPGTGAVRVIWPGDARTFPSTRTANE